MRILDSNKDFYDYCQNVYPDDLNTFDRRDSYDLSKAEFAHRFFVDINFLKKKHVSRSVWDYHRIILLQVCNTFWMFMLTITKTDSFGVCEDYDLILLDKWKDYGVKREKLKLSKPDFLYTTVMFNDDLTDAKTVERMKKAIHINDLKEEKVYNDFTVCRSHESRYDGRTKTIPILKHIGVASFVDAEEIYYALDEYFSKEKTENERDSSIGITNKEKIVNHGFDLKQSFRGK